MRNITQALALDTSTGNVYLRTDANVSVGNANVTVGNVKISNLGNVDISGTTLPVTVTSGNIAVTGNVNSSFVATASDAFGRLRVSNPLTLFDTQARYFDHGQYASNTASGGTVTYNSNSSTFSLAVSGSGSTVIRETTRTFIYQPGKSLLVMNTFAMNTPTTGITQRVGYFNSQNGIFFEVDGTTKNLVIRSYSSGTVVENRVAQTAWNGDKLDGTGPSGYTLYPARTQIFWTDIEWLGVGSVRCGFVINGQFILCHTFNHANQTGNTTTYMSTACLPCRYEITTTSTAGTMTQVCSTVISEGGYSLSGIPQGVGHVLGTPVRLPNDKTFAPLISIRLKSTNSNAIVLPIDFTIVPEDQGLIQFNVYRQGVTSGGSWVSAGSTSSVEYNLAPTSLSSGTISSTGFLISNNQSINTPQNQGFDFTNQLERNPFTPTMYEYVITAATTGTNIDVYASINWQEIS